MGQRLLLVEDDLSLCNNVADYLRAQQFHITIANDGATGESLLREQSFDLVVLDWELPSKDGIQLLELCKTLPNPPAVLMLTGRRSLQDKETGFTGGADDYLTKPFEVRELLARIRAILKNRQALVKSVLTHGALMLDEKSFAVTVDEKPCDLTASEFSVLNFLVRNAGHYFSTEALRLRVWQDSEMTTAAVSTCISRLRKKLESVCGSKVIEHDADAGFRIP